jgi:cytochrome c-type biogenesis protein CcmH
MLEFLLALLTTATVAALLVPLLRRQLERRDRLASDTAVYRDQLAEVERERGRSLSAAEADAARTEIERRLLTAADQDKAAPEVGASWHRFLVPALCLLIPLFALGLYLRTGQPGLPAAPFVARSAPAADDDPASRRDVAQAQRELAQAIATLRARLAERPDDAEALSALGEALTHQADGVVTPEAQGVLRRALEKNAGDARAMFYLGLAEAQGGDSRAALERWRELESRSPPNAPWLPTLRAEMSRVARAAGLPLPAAPAPGPTPGPSQEQMQAMQNLPPADRQQAIRGMVEGLEARLRASSGKPEDRDGWLRLANARRVLGENDKAVEAYAKADAIGPLEPRLLTDWAEAHVRQLQPGAAPSAEAVAVLERLEKTEPRNALALFYLGVADYARGDKPAAARRWKTLLALLPADAPIRAMLEGKIKEAE